MKIFKIVFILFIPVILFFESCRHDQEVVNVYSGRHYQTDENLYREFTSQTGIRVNLVKANSDQLINRLEMEGENSPADILITADAGRLILAKEKGLLQPMDFSKLSEVVPDYLHDEQHYWTGFTFRARVIVYDKERVDPALLDSYESLADSMWKDRILVRSSQNHYNQTLMASIIAHQGEEQAGEWARQLVSNMAQKPKGNDRDQVKAIAAGIGDVAIVNTYYMGLLVNSSNPEEQKVGKQAGIFFPNQQGRGAHVNISGAAITAHSPNTANAQKLIEFLLDKKAQTAFTNETYEYPVNKNIEWSPLLMEWGKFKPDTLPLDELGQHLDTSMIIFDKAEWR